MFTGISSRLGRTVLFGLCAIGMTFGLSAALAGAAIGPMSAKLSVTRSGDPYRPCQVSVDGLLRMSQAEAQALIRGGRKVVVRIWGEDPIFDDLLLGPYVLTRLDRGSASSYIAATPDGLKLHLHDAVASEHLNEDDYPDPAMRDELYAGVRLVTLTGTTIRSFETNRVGGYDFADGCSGRPPAARSGS
jgi:hypothetical protein